MLSKEIVEVGQQIASDLMDARVSHDLGKLGKSGKHVIKKVSEYNNSDLIQKYLDDEIDSVEAIYLAMKREEKKFKPTNTDTKLINKLRSALSLVKNGMSSKEIHYIRSVIVDVIDQLQVSVIYKKCEK